MSPSLSCKYCSCNVTVIFYQGVHSLSKEYSVIFSGALKTYRYNTTIITNQWQYQSQAIP